LNNKIQSLNHKIESYTTTNRRGMTKTQGVDSTDWRPQDLAMMTPEQREGYEQILLRERPKYIPMKPEKITKLSPEDRQEYENSLKTTKTPKHYALRSRPY
jgi:hypothetical protein